MSGIVNAEWQGFFPKTIKSLALKKKYFYEYRISQRNYRHTEEYVILLVNEKSKGLFLQQKSDIYY